LLVLIQSAADAEQLLHPRLSRFALRAAIRVPGIASGRAARWERGLNASLQACGCVAGAVGMLIALVAAIVWRVGYAGPVDWRAFGWRAFVALLIGTAVGKAVGLLWARVRLVRIVAAIRRDAA
jgi:hypothetical protein